MCPFIFLSILHVLTYLIHITTLFNRKKEQVIPYFLLVVKRYYGNEPWNVPKICNKCRLLKVHVPFLWCRVVAGKS